MTTAIVNGTIVTDTGYIAGKALLFDNRIVGIVNPSDIPREAVCVDAEGGYVCAGFIDVHIHGSGGADVMDATPHALEVISRTLPQTGTTAFLATTMTAPRSDIEAALENVRRFATPQEGAHLLGVHMEGPFLNPKRAGAHEAAHIATCDATWLARYSDVVKMLTLAPELAHNRACIAMLRQTCPDMVISAGHSDASYQEAVEAFGEGVRHVTHLFNAMRPYHHREPGLVGACFDQAKVSADIIADTVHTHPHHLRLAHRMLGSRLVLITDAMRAGCMKEGYYELGGQRVEVRNGEVRTREGALAGSVLRMHEAVATLRDTTACELYEAVAAATSRPADVLGLRRKGRLMPGYDADVVILDEAICVQKTYIQGRLVFGM